jgi:hypothetical protein
MIDILLDDREVAKITGRARSTFLAHKAFGVPDLHLSGRIFRLKPPSAPVSKGPGFSEAEDPRIARLLDHQMGDFGPRTRSAGEEFGT